MGWVWREPCRIRHSSAMLPFNPSCLSLFSYRSEDLTMHSILNGFALRSCHVSSKQRLFSLIRIWFYANSNAGQEPALRGCQIAREC